MANSPSEYHISKYGKIAFSPAMWAKIQAGEVSEWKASQAMRQAFRLFRKFTLDEYVSKTFAEMRTGATTETSSMADSIQTREYAEQRSFYHTVGELRKIIAEGNFDPLALEIQGNDAVSLLARAFKHRGYRDSESSVWLDISPVPLIELLAAQGVSPDELHIQTSVKKKDGTKERTITPPEPHRIMKLCREPEEFAYLLNRKDVHVEDGLLSEHVVSTNDWVLGRKSELVEVGLNSGLSIYQTYMKDTKSPLELAQETLRFVVSSPVSAIVSDSFGSGFRKSREKSTLERWQKIVGLVEDRERDALALEKRIESAIHSSPEQAVSLLTKEHMLWLSNIDALDRTLSSCQWGQNDAKALLATIDLLPPHVQRRIPIAIDMLTNLAGPDAALTAQQHHGTLADTPAKTRGGNG